MEAHDRGRQEPHFLRLPFELHHQILSLLPHSSILALRFVHPSLITRVNPFLFSNITLTFGNSLADLASLRSKLAALHATDAAAHEPRRQNVPPFTDSVSHLTLNSCDISGFVRYYGYDDDGNGETDNEEFSARPTTTTTSALEWTRESNRLFYSEARSLASEYAARTIGMLPNLTSLRWDIWADTFDLECSTAIINELVARRHLRDLSLQIMKVESSRLATLELLRHEPPHRRRSLRVMEGGNRDGGVGDEEKEAAAIRRKHQEDFFREFKDALAQPLPPYELLGVGLRSLHFKYVPTGSTCLGWGLYPKFVEKVRGIIQGNRETLRDLKIWGYTNGYGAASNPISSLNDFLPVHGPEEEKGGSGCSPPFKIRTLDITHVALGPEGAFTNICKIHLRNLTLLSMDKCVLSNAKTFSATQKARTDREGEGGGRDGDDPSWYRAFLSQYDWHAPWEARWKLIKEEQDTALDLVFNTLRKEKIYLTSVSFSGLRNSFVEYVSSYSQQQQQQGTGTRPGLQRLTLTQADADSEQTNQSIASKFWSQSCIGLHVGTLRNISICTPYLSDPGFVLSEQSNDMILQCRMLETLDYPGCSSVGPPGLGGCCRDAILDFLPSLLRSCPKLRRWKLLTSTHEYERDSWCGTGMITSMMAMTAEQFHTLINYALLGPSTEGLLEERQGQGGVECELVVEDVASNHFGKHQGEVDEDYARKVVLCIRDKERKQRERRRWEKCFEQIKAMETEHMGLYRMGSEDLMYFDQE